MDYISNTQRVANIRTKLKEEFPDSKFSIRKSSYTGVNINILSAPIDLLQGKGKTNTQVNNYYIKEHYKDNVEARDYLLKVYEIASEGVTWFETSDYGNQPSFYVYISIGDYDKPFLFTPSKNKKLPKQNTPMPRKNYNFDKGELLKECAGWDVYKKTLPDGRLVYNAYKKKETSSNKEDWNAIKGEIYTQSGFKWNRFGFERWGSMTTNDETLILDMLCDVLAKYYVGKEEPKEESKSEFVYGSNWNEVPNNYGAILIETLKSFGFEILEVKRNYFSIFKLNVDLTIDISDNGGEFNIEDGVTKDFITSVAYTFNNNATRPYELAKVIEEIYIDKSQQTQPQNTNIPKFKIGDKVRIPKTRWGEPIENFDFNIIKNAKKNNQDFLYIVDIYINNNREVYKVWLADTLAPKGMDDLSFKMTDNIELYEEAPKPQIRQLTNEDINKLIKGLTYLANDGDELAKKKIKAYQYLLN